jgi:hypothetical protein
MTSLTTINVIMHDHKPSTRVVMPLHDIVSHNDSIIVGRGHSKQLKHLLYVYRHQNACGLHLGKLCYFDLYTEIYIESLHADSPDAMDGWTDERTDIGPPVLSL